MNFPVLKSNVNLFVANFPNRIDENRDLFNQSETNRKQQLFS
jgi:hypothetical protein